MVALVPLDQASTIGFRKKAGSATVTDGLVVFHATTPDW